VFRGVRQLRTTALATALAVWLGGCASLGIADPDNQPITGSAEEAFASSRTDPTAGDDVLVGLAFSGGGTRAAAFAHGVLSEIDQTTVRTRTGTHSLLDSVGFVSGVSGGSVTAAYYGLKKRAALADFREKFLIRNAEAGLNTSVDPLSLVKALGGGVNDVKVFSRWLNENLFDGATFYRASRPPGATATDYGVLQGGLQNDPKKLLPPIAHESTVKTGLSHTSGTISMGRNAPGTATADWFICIGDQTYLDADPKDPKANPGFAAFGRVTEGLEVAEKILGQPVNPKLGTGAMKGEMLAKPVKILKVVRVKA